MYFRFDCNLFLLTSFRDFTAWLNLFIEMENIEVTFEFDQFIIECEDEELIFIVVDPEKKTCRVNKTKTGAE